MPWGSGPVDEDNTETQIEEDGDYFNFCDDILI